jgi:hypothetical protein
VDKSTYDAGTRPLERFFRAKGVPVGVIDDLVQQVWMRWLTTPSLRNVHPTPALLRQLGRCEVYHYFRASTMLDLRGDFQSTDQLIQLQPEGPAAYATGVERRRLRHQGVTARRVAAGMCRGHAKRPAAPGKTYCQACLERKAARARERRGAVA